MAEAKRNSLKVVDGPALLSGVYFAKFTDGTEFKADLRDLPTVNPDGSLTGTKLGDTVDQIAEVCPMFFRTVCYGLKQKLDDSMAGVSDIKDAAEELNSTWDAILKNGWTLRVQGEGVEGGLFARAYAEFKGLSLSDAKLKIGALVEKNVKANKDAAKTDEERAKVTDRRVFNGLRDRMLERDPGLAKAYEELKAKRDAKAKEKAAGGLEFDTSDE
jgi:hypothetical protein